MASGRIIEGIMSRQRAKQKPEMRARKDRPGCELTAMAFDDRTQAAMTDEPATAEMAPIDEFMS
jgi:hypothetical protein